jgi:hypothetical protein
MHLSWRLLASNAPNSAMPTVDKFAKDAYNELCILYAVLSKPTNCIAVKQLKELISIRPVGDQLAERNLLKFVARC